MEKEFEFIEHIADIGVKAYGADMQQAFINTARGMFSIITDLNSVALNEKRVIKVTAADREVLLVAWLNELIYLFEARGILFGQFDITAINDTELRADVYGEKINPAKHILKKQVKAATYHMLKIEQTGDGWTAQVIFDI